VRVTKQRLFIRDLLFSELFTSSGDHDSLRSAYPRFKFAQNVDDVEFSKSAMVIDITGVVTDGFNEPGPPSS